MGYREYEKRRELYLEIVRSINKKMDCDLISLIEEQVAFIESGDFLEDIAYSKDGSIKNDKSFFKEKSELMKLIKILPDHISIRLWTVLLHKLKEMLPKEVKSFRKPLFGRIYTSQDERSVRNAQEILKNDLFETRDFLKSLLDLNNFPSEEVTELLKLIPEDEYFKYDAVSSSQARGSGIFSYELWN